MEIFLKKVKAVGDSFYEFINSHKKIFLASLGLSIFLLSFLLINCLMTGYSHNKLVVLNEENNAKIAELSEEKSSAENRLKQLNADINTLQTEKSKITAELDLLKQDIDIIKYGEDRILATVRYSYRENDIKTARRYIDFLNRYFPESAKIDEIAQLNEYITGREKEEKIKTEAAIHEEKRREEEKAKEKDDFINACVTYNYNDILLNIAQYNNKLCKYAGIITDFYDDGRNLYIVLATTINERKAKSFEKEMEVILAEYISAEEEMGNLDENFHYFFNETKKNERRIELMKKKIDLENSFKKLIGESLADKILVSFSRTDINNVAEYEGITVYGELKGLRNHNSLDGGNYYPFINVKYFTRTTENIMSIFDSRW